MPEEARAIHEIDRRIGDALVILARTETKLDKVISENADHETRIRALERSRWLIVGAAAVAAFGVDKLAGLL